MHAIRSKNIWGIVKRTLNKVDPRLVEHGERVAYIALKILEEAEGEISHEMLKNVLLDVSFMISGHIKQKKLTVSWNLNREMYGNIPFTAAYSSKCFRLFPNIRRQCFTIMRITA